METRNRSLVGASGFPVGFFIGPHARTHAEGRLSGSIKRIRLRVSVKSATKCTIKRVLRALLTLPRTLKLTLNRGTYSDTLNRSAYSIRLTQRHSSIENPTLNPEAPSELARMSDAPMSSYLSSTSQASHSPCLVIRSTRVSPASRPMPRFFSGLWDDSDEEARRSSSACA